MRTHVRVVREIRDGESGVLERLLDEPATWLPGPAHAIDPRAYRVEVHAGSAGHVVDVVVGATRIVPDAFERSLAWIPEGRASAVLPAFQGAIRLVDDIGSVSLEIEGEYTPPVGLVGVAADRLALHRVAEHTLRRFADDVAANLVGDRDAAATRGRRPGDHVPSDASPRWMGDRSAGGSGRRNV